jgi:chaperonin GroEL
MNRKTLYGSEARNKLLSGINQIADAVKVTLGPSGRTVLYAGSYVADYGTRSYPIVVTKDGYKVTQLFDLDDLQERAGSNLVKECAQRSVDQSGDGTTTTVILMRQLAVEGNKAIEAGADPMELKREIDAAVIGVVNTLKEMAIPIGTDNDKIRQIATISANNDVSIGGVIADAFKKIGNEGIIDIQAGKSVTTEIKITPGYRFDQSWIHPYFMNKPEKQMTEFEDPLILIYNRIINHPTQIERTLRIVIQEAKPLLIICPDVVDQGFGILASNVIKQNIRCCVVKAPGIGDSQREEMEDLAKITGGTFMADNRGEDIKKIELKDFGTAKKVVVTKGETVIIEGNSNMAAINKLLDELRTSVKSAKNEDEAAPFEKRIAKLKGSITVIHVGAATETEMKERMDRFDDSVRAVKSAIAEGYTVGAGTALVRIRSGNEIVDAAMDMVLRQICFNVGSAADEVFEQVKNATGNMGYNAKSRKVEDLIEAGVIDPVKVLRCALQNAASSATMFLTTECAITDTF